MPSACNRISAISSRLIVCDAEFSRKEHWIFCHTQDEALLQHQHEPHADHRVRLRDFTVRVNSDWDKIFQRCVVTMKNVYVFWRRSKNVVASLTQFADSLLARLSEWPKHGTKCATSITLEQCLSTLIFSCHIAGVVISRHFLISIYQLAREMNWVIRNECSQSASCNNNNVGQKHNCNFCVKKNSFPSPPRAPSSRGPWGCSLNGLHYGLPLEIDTHLLNWGWEGWVNLDTAVSVQPAPKAVYHNNFVKNTETCLQCCLIQTEGKCAITRLLRPVANSFLTAHRHTKGKKISTKCKYEKWKIRPEQRT